MKKKKLFPWVFKFEIISSWLKKDVYLYENTNKIILPFFFRIFSLNSYQQFLALFLSTWIKYCGGFWITLSDLLKLLYNFCWRENCHLAFAIRLLTHTFYSWDYNGQLFIVVYKAWPQGMTKLMIIILPMIAFVLLKSWMNYFYWLRVILETWL